MTAAGGGPAVRGAGTAAPAVAGGRPPVTARSRGRRLRAVLGLARVEASLLVRSLLVLAGLLAGGAVVWVLIGPAEPLWWDTAWRIGAGQLVLGLSVLIAGQLAAGRARRDGLGDLYRSFPVTAGPRTAAQLAGLAGAVPAGLLLIAAAVAAVQARGAIGAPSIAVLACGLLLVIAAGAAGIAIGTRFPHPLAGMLGALVLLLSSATSHLSSAGGIWLLPWEWTQDQLGALPGPLAGYPPAGGHILELAGLAVLAGAVALTVAASRAQTRGGPATAGILAVAVICVAGALQLRPVPTAELNHLVTEATNPASVQRCSTASGVRYCLYPRFAPLLPSLEAPVGGVLAHLPARPGQPLTVRQVLSPDLLDPTFTHGHPGRQVSQWQAQLLSAPGTATTASAIYLPVGSWPAAGGRLADAHFDLALAAARWAVRIPAQATGRPTGGVFLPCVPAGQAREAIAVWLAILATHPPAGELQDGISGLASGRAFTAVEVHGTMVPTWSYPGSDTSYLGPTNTEPVTAAGYLLAHAMTGLPEQKVAHILAGAWGSWLNWHTTGAQLAAALGIPMPTVPAPPGAIRPPASRVPAVPPGGGPQNPLCTA